MTCTVNRTDVAPAPQTDQDRPSSDFHGERKPLNRSRRWRTNAWLTSPAGLGIAPSAYHPHLIALTLSLLLSALVGSPHGWRRFGRPPASRALHPLAHGAGFVMLRAIRFRASRFLRGAGGAGFGAGVLGAQRARWLWFDALSSDFFKTWRAFGAAVGIA